MTTEHTVVRSGKSKRKQFNSKCGRLLANYCDLCLYPLVLRDTSNICILNPSVAIMRCGAELLLVRMRATVDDLSYKRVKVLCRRDSEGP
jgi:hypothetical protein